MRHKVFGRKLNRTSSHRLAMFSNMSNSLLLHEQIKTTVAKAKDLRPIVEKIITLGKRGTLHDRRRAVSMIKDNSVVQKVFSVLAERYRERNGGYIRIIKAGHRHGDCADMAIIELIDRDVNAKGAADKERVLANKEVNSNKN